MFEERGEKMFPEKHKWTVRLGVLLLLVATALIRSGNLPFFGSLGGAFLTLPLLICLSLFETELASVLFGLIAGALWDYSSPLPDGAMTLFCGVVGFLCAMAVRFFIRRKLSSALVGSALFLIVSSLLFSCMAAQGLADVNTLFLYYYLPCAVCAMLFVPVDYYIVKGLYRDRNEDKVI